MVKTQSPVSGSCSTNICGKLPSCRAQNGARSALLPSEKADTWKEHSYVRHFKRKLANMPKVPNRAKFKSYHKICLLRDGGVGNWFNEPGHVAEKKDEGRKKFKFSVNDFFSFYSLKLTMCMY